MIKAKTIKIYLTTLVVFLGIDSIWLTQVSPSTYKHYIGYLLSDNPNLLAALIFYLLFVLGMVVLVILPALQKKSLQQAATHGALLGLVSYATYDLTNLAVVAGWPIAITVIDLAWGTSLSLATATISYSIAKKYLK